MRNKAVSKTHIQKKLALWEREIRTEGEEFGCRNGGVSDSTLVQTETFQQLFDGLP